MPARRNIDLAGAPAAANCHSTLAESVLSTLRFIMSPTAPMLRSAFDFLAARA